MEAVYDKRGFRESLILHLRYPSLSCQWECTPGYCELPAFYPTPAFPV